MDLFPPTSLLRAASTAVAASPQFQHIWSAPLPVVPAPTGQPPGPLQVGLAPVYAQPYGWWCFLQRLGILLSL